MQALHFSSDVLASGLVSDTLVPAYESRVQSRTKCLQARQLLLVHNYSVAEKAGFMASNVSKGMLQRYCQSFVASLGRDVCSLAISDDLATYRNIPNRPGNYTHWTISQSDFRRSSHRNSHI